MYHAKCTPRNRSEIICWDKLINLLEIFILLGTELMTNCIKTLLNNNSARKIYKKTPNLVKCRH